MSVEASVLALAGNMEDSFAALLGASLTEHKGPRFFSRLAAQGDPLRGVVRLALGVTSYKRQVLYAKHAYV